jgi:aminoglycoside phosphotransferase (APT) family kinase protein
MLGFEDDCSLLGARFYVMERVDARAAPDNPHFTTGGWVVDLPTKARERMWRDMVSVLSRLHAVDRSKFPFLEKPELGSSGLEQALNFWLRYAAWSGADEFPVVRQAMEWLKANMPTDGVTCATWGGGGPQNFLFRDDGSVSIILDWDMASLAGAETDLSIWFVMDAHRRLPGFGTPRQTVDLWEELSGRKLQNMEWHLVFASYMLDVITIRLPRLLRQQGLLDDAGYQIFMARAGIRAAAQLGLEWSGPPIAPPIRLDK